MPLSPVSVGSACTSLLCIPRHLRWFSIEEVGIFKPSSKVYEIPIKKYKIDKHEVAFLSSNTWDVCGGGNFGYNSIWVNRSNAEFDILDYQPKNEIGNLSQLLDIL